MRVRILKHMVGPGLNWPRGLEREIHDNEAMRLIAAGIAETIVPDGKGVEWEMRMPPADYIKRFPDGPNAERARQLVG